MMDDAFHEKFNEVLKRESMKLEQQILHGTGENLPQGVIFADSMIEPQGESFAKTWLRNDIEKTFTEPMRSAILKEMDEANQEARSPTHYLWKTVFGETNRTPADKVTAMDASPKFPHGRYYVHDWKQGVVAVVDAREVTPVYEPDADEPHIAQG